MKQILLIMLAAVILIFMAVAALWTALMIKVKYSHVRIIKMHMLTGCRREEAWEHIDRLPIVKGTLDSMSENDGGSYIYSLGFK